MAALSYLWKNRAKPEFGSALFLKVWLKRLLLLPSLVKRNYRRRVLLNAGATISETAEIGDMAIEGSKELLSVGKFSFVGKATITLHEELNVKSFVCINDGVEILTASHDVGDPQWRHIKKKIIIEDYAWIGTRAILLPGVHIGRGAVVGAGAVVSKSVEAYNIVVGNPAKPIDKKRCTELNYNPCEFLAANRAWLIG